MKKLFVSLTASLAVFAFVAQLAIPASAQAQTSSSFCYTFTKNLGEGRSISAADASALAIALSSAGVWNSATPITTYSDMVASAVSGFQEKYAAQILAPNGLSYGTGYVGASTRAELNSLYGCQSAPITTTTSTQCPAGYVCTPIVPPTAAACPAGYTCTPITTMANPASPSCSTGDYAWCYKGTNTPNQYSPVLTSISPIVSPVGGLVTLYGSNFSSPTEVHIGTYQFGSIGTDLSIAPSTVSASGNSLSFFVPTSLTPGTYAVSVYNVSGSNERSSSLSLTVASAVSTPTANAPVINSIGGPTTLATGQTGTWTIQASDPQNGYLNYSVNWGDNQATPMGTSAAVNQTTTFSHSYYSAGTYTATFTVTDSAGLSSASSITVQVGSGSTQADSANLSLDATSPLAQTVAVTNTSAGLYLGLPVLVFDVNAQGDNMHLHSLTVNINTAGSTGGTVNAAYLYQGSTAILSSSIVNGQALFQNIPDGTFGATIPVNTTLPYTVKVDVTGVTNSSIIESVTASVASETIYNSADSSVPVTGNANGNTIIVNQ